MTDAQKASKGRIMLTPRFSIDQDDNFVLVTIYAPFTNVAETEVFMDEEDFR